MDEILIASLEELRELSGGPIYVNSGYRCPAHNKTVGGSENSYPRELVRYVRLIPAFKGVGLYCNRIHVDIREKKVFWKSNAVSYRIP